MGKSDVALRLAEAIGGEILVADSRQVYRELEIATNKPRPEQLARVRYHCVGIADPRRPFNVHQWVAAAEGARAQVVDRGRQPVIEGATMLYVDALTDGLTLAGVAPDPELRARLAGLPAAQLAAQVRHLDPAAEVDWHNPVRLIRALEILHALGPPLAAHRRRVPPAWRHVRIGLDLPRPRLAERILARSAEQIDRGLLEETAQALAGGVPADGQALTGTGYREAVAVLEGRLRPDQLLAEMTRANLRLARRQLTWMRRDQRIRWFAAEPDPLAGILAYLREGPAEAMSAGGGDRN